MKRDEWLRLNPREKLIHRVQRLAERLQKAQDRYDRLRASGKIAKSILFFER
jgi:hypothetical protein